MTRGRTAERSAPFRAGFRDPLGERGTALFSFEMGSCPEANTSLPAVVPCE